MTTLGVVSPPQLPERLRPVAEAADRYRIDELWLWEDCFCEGGISAAAAALAWTQRLTVGIGVLPVPLRNVALTAMEVATLARLFPGRIEVGVGHGVLDWMGQVGARAESPMTLLREYVAALRALLAGETVTTEGRYVRLQDVRLAYPPADGLAVHVGAKREKTLALAGELGDGTVLTDDTGADGVRRARAVVDRARQQAGRPGRNRITVFLAVDRAGGGGTGPGVSGGAAAVSEAVRQWADAGADTVALLGVEEDDVLGFVRFVGEQVRPLLT